MSIKRISRIRVATPIAEYVEPLATRISFDDSRTGGDVETRTGGDVETKAGGDIITKSSPDTARSSPDTARCMP
jgi:hypothetical protein